MDYDGWNRTADTIDTMGVPWIIPGWLAAEEIHVLAGAAKTGKSLLAVELAAIITTGRKWFDGTEVESGRVAFYSSEEDVRKILLPRFKAAEGNDDLFHLGAVSDLPLDAAKRLDEIRGSLTGSQYDNAPPLRLVVIDGVASAVSNVNDNTEVREYLYTVKMFAAYTGAAVLLITHTAKGSESKYSKAQDYVLGAQAWVAVPRMTWVMARDKTVAKKAAMLVRLGNLPWDMSGAVRVHGSEFIELEPDAHGRKVMASKITQTEVLTGDSDELFIKAVGANEQKTIVVSNVVEDAISNSIVDAVKKHGKDNGGWVRRSDLLNLNLASERKVTDTIEALCKAGKLRSQNGINGSPGATKWLCLPETPPKLGNGLDTAVW